MSRVDSFMASRRRAMIFHSVWKPMLAGAVGAAIMAATVIGSVWVILPKIVSTMSSSITLSRGDVSRSTCLSRRPSRSTTDVQRGQAVRRAEADPTNWPPTLPYAPQDGVTKKFTPVGRNYKSARDQRTISSMQRTAHAMVRTNMGKFFVHQVMTRTRWRWKMIILLLTRTSCTTPRRFGVNAFCNKIPAKKYEIEVLDPSTRT